MHVFCIQNCAICRKYNGEQNRYASLKSMQLPIFSPLPHSPQWKTGFLRMRHPSPLQCMAAQLASCLCVGMSIWGIKPVVSRLLTLQSPSQMALIYIQANACSPTSQPSSTSWTLPLCHLFNVVAWTWVIGNLEDKKRGWSQISRKCKQLTHYFFLPFPWLPRNSFTF